MLRLSFNVPWLCDSSDKFNTNYCKYKGILGIRQDSGGHLPRYCTKPLLATVILKNYMDLIFLLTLSS